MKSTVIGVSRMQGIGKTSKQPYDMARVFVLNPIKPFAKDGLQISGFGFEVAEISMTPDALSQFSGMTFPATIDLQTDMESRGGKLVPIVTGIRKAA